MIWTQPPALLLLLAVPALAGMFMAAFRWKERLLASAGDPRVLAKLTDPLSRRKQRVKAVFLTLAAALWAVALAGPRWGQKFQEIHRRGVDVVLALDVSRSMLAEDIKPNRLTQAKREFGLLLNGLTGDRVGVVAFAGTAFLQCPLTLDYGAARLLLDILDTESVPLQGTSLSQAINSAREAFVRHEKKHKALVILTDGEDNGGRVDQAVEKAREEGVRIFAIGFGNPEGEIIPVRDSDERLVEYKKDKSGQTVVSKLNESALQDMAERTGGQYYRASNGEIEVERVLADIRNMDKKTLQSKDFDTLEDRTLWFVIPVFLLLLLELLWPETKGHVAWVFRTLENRLRRVTLFSRRASAFPLTLAILLSGAGAPSQARGLLPGGDQAQKYRQELASNPGDPVANFRLGNALFRQRDFQSAQESFGSAQASFRDPKLRAASAYNAGNALFRQGKLPEAIDKYKQALRINPRDLDAKHNLEFALAIKDAKKGGGQAKQEPGKDKKPGEERKSAAGDGEGEKKEDKKSAARPDGDMDKASAEQILAATQDQEREARKRLKMPEPENKTPEQDW